MAIKQWKEIEEKFKDAIETQNILLSLENEPIDKIFSQLQSTKYCQESYIDILSRKIVSCVRSHPQTMMKYIELCNMLNNYFLEKQSKVDFLNTFISILSFSKDCQIINGYQEFLNNMEKIILNKTEYKEDPIISLFRTDDVQMLQKLHENATFDIDYLYHFDNPMFFPGSISTHLIHLAAYFGALKCFKYLLINGASLHTKDEIFGSSWFQIEDAAIYGGCIEIIKLLEQRNYTKFSLATAALTNRNLIFKWIYGHKFQQEMSLSSLYCSSIANNLELMIFCIKNGEDINSINENPLIAAINFANYEVVQLLFWRNRLDVNIETQNHENILTLAKKHNDLKMCKLILSHPKFRGK